MTVTVQEDFFILLIKKIIEIMIGLYDYMINKNKKQRTGSAACVQLHSLSSFTGRNAFILDTTKLCIYIFITLYF